MVSILANPQYGHVSTDSRIMSFIVELLDSAVLSWKFLTALAQEHYLIAKFLHPHTS